MVKENDDGTRWKRTKIARRTWVTQFRPANTGFIFVGMLRQCIVAAVCDYLTGSFLCLRWCGARWLSFIYTDSDWIVITNDCPQKISSTRVSPKTESGRDKESLCHV